MAGCASAEEPRLRIAQRAVQGDAQPVQILASRSLSNSLPLLRLAAPTSARTLSVPCPVLAVLIACSAVGGPVQGMECTGRQIAGRRLGGRGAGPGQRGSKHPKSLSTCRTASGPEGRLGIPTAAPRVIVSCRNGDGWVTDLFACARLSREGAMGACTIHTRASPPCEVSCAVAFKAALASPEPPGGGPPARTALYTQATNKGWESRQWT